MGAGKTRQCGRGRMSRADSWRAIRRVPSDLLSRDLILGAFCLLTAAIGACGFQLRGAVDIPPELNPIYIESAPGSPVRAALYQQLQGSQVRLAAQPQDANVILRISNERRSSRVIAVDRNGKVLARELQYRLLFEAVTVGGKELVPKQGIDVLRSYENPDVEVLGKQLEAQMIYQDMYIDAANRMLIRLRAALL